MKPILSAFLLIFASACGCRKVRMHNVPPEAEQCKHECALAVARGGSRNWYVNEDNFYRCLSTCPGVTVTIQCENDSVSL